MMNIPRRNICVSTGKRGGFGALVRLMRLIDQDPDLELQVIVTDMHLSETFGYTVQEVERYFSIAEHVRMDQEGDSGRDRAEALGRCMSRMAAALERLGPDIVVLLGDRSETLATAFACVEAGIPVGHIQAGDQSGGLDDIHRAAITKLCHLHFAQTERQAARVLSMGEEAWRVFVTGAPYVDRIIAREFTEETEVAKLFDLDLDRPITVVLQHSDTCAPNRSYQDMREVLEPVVEFDGQAVICYPCSDQGYAGVIKAIQEFETQSNCRVRKNIDSVDFLGLLAVADVMVGNSSSAIIEAPYFDLPAVNVGNRQRGRERGSNVIDVEPSRHAILAGLRRAIDPEFRRWLRRQPKPFGDGTASEKIFNEIRKVPTGPSLFEKRLTV